MASNLDVRRASIDVLLASDFLISPSASRILRRWQKAGCDQYRRNFKAPNGIVSLQHHFSDTDPLQHDRFDSYSASRSR
jgi:hypothetical protein